MTSEGVVGQQFIVTNATAGAGLEAARVLLHRGAFVVVTGRTAVEAQEAAALLRGEAQAAGTGLVEGMALDPLDLDSVRHFARAFKARVRRAVHGLVHGVVDAEVASGAAVEFPPGADRALMANHLAPFLLTQLLLPLLIGSAPARVVLCAEAAHASGDAARLRGLCVGGRVRGPRTPSAGAAATIGGLGAVWNAMVDERARTSLQATADAQLGCMLHAGELHRRLCKHQLVPSKLRVVVALEQTGLADAASAPLPIGLIAFSSRHASRHATGQDAASGMELASVVAKDATLGAELWRHTTEICSFARPRAPQEAATPAAIPAPPGKKKRGKGAAKAGFSNGKKVKRAKPETPALRGYAAGGLGKVEIKTPARRSSKPEATCASRKAKSAVQTSMRGAAAAHTKIGPMGPPPGTVVTDGIEPDWSDPLECLAKLPDNPVVTLPHAEPDATPPKPANLWATRIAKLGRVSDAARGSPSGGLLLAPVDVPLPQPQPAGIPGCSPTPASCGSFGGAAAARRAPAFGLGHLDDLVEMPSGSSTSLSSEAASVVSVPAGGEEADRIAEPAAAALLRAEAEATAVAKWTIATQESTADAEAEDGEISVSVSLDADFAGDEPPPSNSRRKNAKFARRAKGVGEGGEAEGEEEDRDGEKGEENCDVSEIAPADLASDLRRATKAAKGFQSQHAEEERRLASVRVLAVLQNARALILNWSVTAGSASAAGFAKVHRSIAQLESLLLADPQHAQARLLKKQLVQIVKDDETRARIYAINALKAQQERTKFDHHMLEKVKPLLGRQCFIPAEVVNMPVSAQAEFLNAGTMEMDAKRVEGCILKSAGGGLVWVYIFAERMPFRFWMSDAQGWLSDHDKLELGLPILVYKDVETLTSEGAWKKPDLLPDLAADADVAGRGANGDLRPPYWAQTTGEKPPLVRRAVDLKSAEVGRLPIGTRVHVLLEKAMPDGLRRVQIAVEGDEKPYGWMTSTTKDGTKNLSPVVDAVDDPASTQASSASGPSEPAAPVDPLQLLQEKQLDMQQRRQQAAATLVAVAKPKRGKGAEPKSAAKPEGKAKAAKGTMPARRTSEPASSGVATVPSGVAAARQRCSGSVEAAEVKALGELELGRRRGASAAPRMAAPTESLAPPGVLKAPRPRNAATMAASAGSHLGGAPSEQRPKQGLSSAKCRKQQQEDDLFAELEQLRQLRAAKALNGSGGSPPKAASGAKPPRSTTTGSATAAQLCTAELSAVAPLKASLLSRVEGGKGPLWSAKTDTASSLSASKEVSPKAVPVPEPVRKMAGAVPARSGGKLSEMSVSKVQAGGGARWREGASLDAPPHTVDSLMEQLLAQAAVEMCGRR